MKRIQLACFSLAIIGMVSCKNETKKEMDTQEDEVQEVVKQKTENKELGQSKRLAFNLASKSDSDATGSVVFSETNGKVTFKAKIQGLTPGTHAIHIHEEADCSSPDGTSTGGHWNPTFEDHGKWGDAGGYHKGDIGNFEADADGNGSVTMTTDEWCIGCDDDTKNVLGKAIIVHQGVDDFTSQPSGAAGARVSCGGIIQ